MDISTLSHYGGCREPSLGYAITGGQDDNDFQREKYSPVYHSRKGKTRRASRGSRPRRTPALLRARWDHGEREDGLGLASDPTVTLPNEKHRRAPSLERQGAFRVPRAWEVSDAELYRLGILYEDSHERGNERERGPDFCLDAIVHPEQPAYSLRAAKRARRRRRRTSDRRLSTSEGDKLSLSVDLLSSYLGGEDFIARFLAPILADDKRDWEQRGNSTASNKRQGLSTEADGSPRPLTIIYELEDTISSSTLVTEATELPDLISDMEDESCGEVMGEESSFARSWDELGFNRRVDDSADEGYGNDDMAVVVGFDEETMATSTAVGDDETWILIAGDDS
ncbi:hypothetical protein GGS20DRAFT_28401 [Poronia punctata]|nr:hypothetical protein GGS20DRAFT_28401 [Poronia punctata]